MPRPNRFHIPFSERLRQSRVARGQEPEPVIESPTLGLSDLSLFWHDVGAQVESPRIFAQWAAESLAATTPAERLIAARRGSSTQANLYRHLTAQLDQQLPVNGHTAQIIYDEVATQATPVPQTAAPKEERMSTPTEQTLITVLQQAVGNAIEMLRNLADQCKKHVPDCVPVVTAMSPSHFDNPQCAFEVKFNVHDSPFSTHNSYLPFITGDHYTHTKRVFINNLVIRHTAVLNELECLGATANSLASFREREIADLSDYFADNHQTLYICALPESMSCSSAALPQLGCEPSAIRFDSLPAPAMQFTAHTPLWKVREKSRNASARTPLPDEIQAALGQEVMDTYYPYLATKPGNVGLIAFTQSATAGMLDRQQIIKPGRFLRQHLPDASDEQIKQLAAACLGAMSAGVTHSKDSDDFERVYRQGPSSCMAYGPDGKQFHRLKVNGEFYHPARVYAHPENDIEIVWLEVAGRIGARAVVNTANKQYPALYGSDSVAGAHKRLLAYLEGLGYTHDDQALDGQKLRKVYTDNGAIICPYIDSGNRGVYIEDDHLMVGGECEANHETGCLHDHDNNEPDWHCDCCGDGQSDSDDRYNTIDDEYVCCDCANQHYSYVFVTDTGTHEYVSDNENFHTDLSPRNNKGKVYIGNGLDEYQELDSRWYHNAVCHDDYCIETADGDYILIDDMERHGYFNADDGYAELIEEYAIFDDELVKRGDVPGDAVLCPLDTDRSYPMLPVFQAAEQDEEDESQECAA